MITTCFDHLTGIEYFVDNIIPSSSSSTVRDYVKETYSDTHGSCLCAGKNDVALLYNWLVIFRLTVLA
jgi:hypothetical protein